MTEHIHSPFHVVENFISPANCEKLIAEFGISVPSRNAKGQPLKNERNTTAEEMQLVQNSLYENLADIQGRYAGIAKEFGEETPTFRQYFEDPKHPAELHGCESSRLFRKKWVKHKDVDLVGMIWLKDFGNGVPLDPRFEVYGGKLEFPLYRFSLVPQRGTLVIFPAGPQFITAISPVLVGSLEMLKFTMKLTTADGSMWNYDPSKFPGDYTTWFE